MASMTAGTIESYTHFLKRDPLYNIEKPYTLRYTAPNGFPRANIKLDRHNLSVRDIRPQKDELSLDRNGCFVWSFQTRMTYNDFDDKTKILDVYLSEVADRLRTELGAEKVQVFEHTVRKRHSEFPISTGEPYDFNQPTSIAHIDATIGWCHAMARQLNPGNEMILQQRIQCINVWKPLRGPVKDWPLALCEPASLDALKDLEPCDLVYPDYVVENRQVYHSDKLRWFHLSDQREDEAWVFLQTDTARRDWTVAHTAFPMPKREETVAPRESIELRALVFYKD